MPEEDPNPTLLSCGPPSLESEWSRSLLIKQIAARAERVFQASQAIPGLDCPKCGELASKVKGKHDVCIWCEIRHRERQAQEKVKNTKGDTAGR